MDTLIAFIGRNDILKKYIVGEDGEYLGEINQGDKILRRKSYDYFNDTQTWNLENFYKGHSGEIRKLLLELNVYEKALLFSISTYVGYEDCCIKYDNGNCIGTEDIIELSGLKRSVSYDAINSLIQKDVLYKGKNSKNRQYFINPWLFCRGQRINKVLRTMFKNYKIRVLGGVKWQEMKD